MDFQIEKSNNVMRLITWSKEKQANKAASKVKIKHKAKIKLIS